MPAGGRDRVSRSHAHATAVSVLSVDAKDCNTRLSSCRLADRSNNPVAFKTVG